MTVFANINFDLFAKVNINRYETMEAGANQCTNCVQHLVATAVCICASVNS